MAETKDRVSAKPDAGGESTKTVTFHGVDYTCITEGLAQVLVPRSQDRLESGKNRGRVAESQNESVFYNPIQQFNRDLSVLAISVHGKDVLREREKQREKVRQRKNERQQRKVQKNASLLEITESHSENAGIKRQAADELDCPPSKQTRTEVDCSVSNTAQEVPSLDGQGAHRHSESESQSAPKAKPRFKVLDALSATGLRALRYASEIDFVTNVTANDLSAEAVKSIQLNADYNGLADKIKPNVGNAMSHMYYFMGQDNDEFIKSGGKYDVIDLDPYGTAAPFLDASMHAINDGGLLCVTCTDAAVWASNSYPEKSYALYGGTPMKGYHSHEAGLRLIIHAVAQSAARYGMAIEPLLSLSIDYYARVFVRVRKSQAEVKHLLGKTMVVYTCDSGCGAWTTQFLGRHEPFKARDGSTQFKHSFAQGPTASPHCEHCGFKTHLAGPMYGGPIHNSSFIQAILDEVSRADKQTYGTTERMEGMLTTALEETLTYGTSQADPNAKDEQTGRPSETPSEVIVERNDPAAPDAHPFFFNTSQLARVLRCTAPAESLVRGALRHAGYLAVRSHTKAGTIRTNAPWKFIWQIMREWVRQRAPIKEGALRPNMAGWKIMYGSEGNANDAGGGHAGTSNGERVSNGDQAGSRSNSASRGDVLRTSPPPAVVFDEALGRNKDAGKVVRYQMNPKENWGPQQRARG